MEAVVQEALHAPREGQQVLIYGHQKRKREAIKLCCPHSRAPSS